MRHNRSRGDLPPLAATLNKELKRESPAASQQPGLVVCGTLRWRRESRLADGRCLTSIGEAMTPSGIESRTLIARRRSTTTCSGSPGRRTAHRQRTASTERGAGRIASRRKEAAGQRQTGHYELRRIQPVEQAANPSRPTAACCYIGRKSSHGRFALGHQAGLPMHRHRGGSSTCNDNVALAPIDHVRQCGCEGVPVLWPGAASGAA
ncbi:MAG: hypothetical protein MNPFHGCM_02587 [Gemmatimonadaceae bacterium]|nr:hypothetical protein [Gemmatimonadaceae bacterium]